MSREAEWQSLTGIKKRKIEAALLCRRSKNSRKKKSNWRTLKGRKWGKHKLRYRLCNCVLAVFHRIYPPIFLSLNIMTLLKHKNRRFCPWVRWKSWISTLAWFLRVDWHMPCRLFIPKKKRLIGIPRTDTSPDLNFPIIVFQKFAFSLISMVNHQGIFLGQKRKVLESQWPTWKGAPSAAWILSRDQHGFLVYNTILKPWP